MRSSVARVTGSVTRASTRSRSCSRATWSASSLMRYDSGSSGTARRQLPVGDVTVDARLGRQPEHALADHVAMHLAGAAADRAAELLEQGERPVGVQRAVRAEDRDADLGALAPSLGPEHLHDRTVDRRCAAGADRRLQPFLQVALDR